MSSDPIAGDFVKHEKFGNGKVISSDGVLVRIYFKNTIEPSPSKRVRTFKAPWPNLTFVDPFPDPELDNLPPWTGDRFEGAKITRTLDDAKKVFLRFFSEGLDDPGFTKHEKQYKLSACERYNALIRKDLYTLASNDDHAAIAARLDAVYGDPKAPKIGPDTRLNLLYQKIDEPAYFDALRAGGSDTSRYAEAASEFIESANQTTFDEYLAALRKLPTRKGGAAIDGWTTLTWLPFIAAPDRHIVIKPTIVQSFASALPYEIQYSSDLNYRTYSRCVDMAKRLGDILATSELNLQGRELNMIDVQSFMWVVERWTGTDPTS